MRNNGGGHYNHSLFWQLLTNDKSKNTLSGELQKAINNTFGSVDAFKAEFEKAAATRFGSGWAWLILDNNGELAVTSTANQDNPLMDVAEKQGQPLLGLDVWEHAYYLNYQNRRPDYISSFWSVVNWSEVERLYVEAQQALASK
ncbi:iron/manganese superoxide dismutase-like protein [Pontibacter ummariensis]|uniref:superoxide dismutase n=1 Tax=Pontibacter ummariensis TaxID=1610492 RepID=A0A239KG11_9BACT|nr:iron/manganese superoxide dismutase-like protein [Pontibacter ummariensis]SNT16642.1 Iron/manganese superoxide dismutase, C-terminal domain [Pontibacter ummariensis]